MSKICAIGERKIVLGALMQKVESGDDCHGCGLWVGRCKIPGPATESIENGGSECDCGALTQWILADSSAASTWAHQAIAALPALPEALTGEHHDRAQRVRDDVANLLNVFAAEMDAEGGVA